MEEAYKQECEIKFI
jgi:serine/threonine protein kinase